MNRQAGSATRLAGVLVAAALIAVACGGHQPGQVRVSPDGAGTPNPPAATLPAEPPAASESVPALASAEPAASAAVMPAAVYSAPPVSRDPVTSYLSSIDQSIQSVGSSISGADAGTSGGE